MVLPSSIDIQFQILTLLDDQQVHGLPELKDRVARKFEVSNDDRKKLSKKKRPIFDTKIINALSVLRKNDHIVNQKRGNFKITKSGINRLKSL
jgi:restriction endonuclease Mrr